MAVKWRSHITKWVLWLLLGLNLVVGVGSFALENRIIGSLNKLEGEVKEYTLSNGLRVLFYKRSFAPVFSGYVSVKVGGVDEIPGITGISHMFEHMAFKGTISIGSKDWKRERRLLKQLEDVAEILWGDGSEQLSKEEREKYLKIFARIQEQADKLVDSNELVRLYTERGARELNATTTKDSTNYFVSLPVDAFEFWCKIESERLINPVLREFYKERDVVMAERRMRYDDNPQGRIYELLLANAFMVSPYRYPVIGYPEDLMRLTARKTKKFRDRYYIANNIVIAIVGDIDPEEGIKTVEKYFGRIPTGVRPPEPYWKEPRQTGEKVINHNDYVSPMIVIGYRKKAFPHEDDAPVTVMYEALAGRRTSPLYHMLVNEMRLASYLSVYEVPGNRYDNIFVFEAGLNAGVSHTRFLKAFEQVARKAISRRDLGDLIEATKANIIMEGVRMLGDNMSMARALANSELVFNDWRLAIEWYKDVMKVDVEDVRRVFNGYFDRNQRIVVNVHRLKR